jgi:beta-glucanase (GH16 family)
VDEKEYFSANADSVSPNEWVYDHPFYLLLNMAVGGNLGGPLDPDLPESNKLAVDYIRLYEYDGFGEVFEI